MRFAFSDDQITFAEALRELLNAECTPAHVRAVWDAGSGFDSTLWERLADMGVTGMMVDESDGGFGASMVDAVLLFQELGRAIVPGPVIESFAIAAPALVGTPWIAGLIDGTVVATAALDADEIVPHAEIAHVVLVPDGVVELENARLVDQHGIDHGRSLASVQGGSRSAHSFDLAAAHGRAAVATAAYLIGAAEAMIDMSGEYARERKQFGRPIGSFQAVKHLLADALLKVEFAKAPTYRAAWSLSVDADDAERDVSMAKALANEAAHAASRAAIQVHGAIGYTWECDLHMWMKKVWALERAHGTTSWHRRRVSSAVLHGST